MAGVRHGCTPSMSSAAWGDDEHGSCGAGASCQGVSYSHGRWTWATISATNTPEPRRPGTRELPGRRWKGWDIGARPPVPDRRTGARAECPSISFANRAAGSMNPWRVAGHQRWCLVRAGCFAAGSSANHLEGRETGRFCKSDVDDVAALFAGLRRCRRHDPDQRRASTAAKNGAWNLIQDRCPSS